MACLIKAQLHFCIGQNIVFLLKLLRSTAGASLFPFPVSSSFLCLLMLPFLCLLNSFLSFPIGIDVLYIGPLKGEPHHNHTHSVGLCASAIASSLVPSAGFLLRTATTLITPRLWYCVFCCTSTVILCFEAGK